MREKIISKLLRLINKVEKIDEDRIKYNSEYFAITLKYRYNKLIEKLKIK